MNYQRAEEIISDFAQISEEDQWGTETSSALRTASGALNALIKFRKYCPEGYKALTRKVHERKKMEAAVEKMEAAINKAVEVAGEGYVKTVLKDLTVQHLGPK